MRWQIDDIARPEYPIMLEYPIRPEPRYGEGKPAHPEISRILAEDTASYEATVVALGQYFEPISRIPDMASVSDPGQPCWNNAYFSSLDAISLYGLLGMRKPRRYFEIGSGNSTMFARRAIRDLGLKSQIISIDPNPRAEVDALCDRVIRQPLEDVDPSVLTELQEGDFLFVDNSHRVFTNSDATVFFLEVLPRLKSGVTVHVHDIFLPFDYPRSWMQRHYSEQYMLAIYLIAGYSKIRTILPLAYLSKDSVFGGLINRTWGCELFRRIFSRYRNLTGGYAGVSFWLETK